MFKGNRVGTPHFFRDQATATSTAADPFNDQPIKDNISTGQCNVLNGNAILGNFGFYSMEWRPSADYVLNSAEGIRIGATFTWERPKNANQIGIELSASLRIITALQMPIIPIYGDLTGTPTTEFQSVDIRNVKQIALATPELDANREGMRHNEYRVQVVVDVGTNTSTQYHFFGWEIWNNSGGNFNVKAFAADFGIRQLNNQFFVNYRDPERN